MVVQLLESTVPHPLLSHRPEVPNIPHHTELLKIFDQ